MMGRTLREQLAPLVRSRSGGPLGCGKKVRYLTQQHAASVARLRQEDEGVPLYSYRCPVCDGFHVTKLKPPEAK